MALRSLLSLVLFLMSEAAQTSVKYKLQAAVSPQECPATAEEVGRLVGLENVRRVFRGGAKHEASQVAAGLHLWYQGVAPSEEEAKRVITRLEALTARVEIAELEQAVKLH